MKKLKSLRFLLICLAMLTLSACGDNSSEIANRGNIDPPGTGTGPIVTGSKVGTVALTSPSTTTGLTASNSGTAGAATGVLRVTVRDTTNQPLANQAVTFFPDAGTVTGAAVTDENGFVQVQYNAPTTLGDVRISAAAGGVQSNDITINIHSGPAKTIAVYALPSTLGPSGTATIKAFVTDNNGYPVATGTSCTAVVSASNSGAIMAEVGSTDASGQVIFTSYVAGTTAGTDTVKVSSGTANGTATIAVSQLASNLKTFTVVPSATSLIADGSDFLVLTATAIDDANNPVAGVNISFNTTLGTLKVGSNAASSSVTATTDATGNARVSLIAGKTVGTARVAAQTTSGFAAVNQIPFVPGAPATVSLSAFPLSIFAGGTATLQAAAFDANNNPVVGDNLIFLLADNDTGTVNPVTVATDASGRGTATYTAGANPGTFDISVSTSNGKVPTTKPQITVSSNEPASVAVAAANTSLSLGGATTLTVTVKDSLGNGLPNIPVSLSSTIGSVVGQVTTDSAGEASVTFGAGTISGSAVITAVAGSQQGSVTVEITPGTAGAINLQSVSPDTRTIHVQQSLLTNTATLFFAVKDSYGNPAADDTPVAFALTGAGTGGGELLTVDGTAYNTAVTGNTVAGVAAVTLRSGSVSGVVDIIASINTGAVSTVARINIVGALPDAAKLSLSAAVPTNLAGFVWDGLKTTIKGVVVDRFGNVPADGTVVTLYTECGVIGNSGGFTTSTVNGEVTADFTTIASDKSNAQCVDTTVVLTTTGDESWTDTNGNGLVDAGEPCIKDLGEPYIDRNNNGSFDAGSETYIDTNKNGVYNGPNGVCEKNKIIWASAPLIRYTGNVGSINLSPTSFAVAIGDKQTFTYNFRDVNGNALVAGTVVEVTATAGTLTGATKVVMPDSKGLGQTYQVSLWSSFDTAAKPTLAEVIVTITPPNNVNNNGAEVYTTAAGTINNPVP